ncbi:MAG: thioredoxin domain-containing protein [Sphingomonadales bacterium]|nr:thioredoxin domain-containing protein [Sphingomonadales bacterium]
MSRPAYRTLALALVALPLALTACKKDGADATAPSGAPIAKIAPPAGKAWSDVVSATPEGGFVMGNPNAPIKLVEYGSLTCPHCAEFAEKSAAPLRDNFVASGRVSFEFRNFVRDAIDITAAQLTHCGTPESFFPLTEQVFANQKDMFAKAQAAGQPAYEAAMNQTDGKRGLALGQLTGLVDFFAARGISKDQAAACLSDTAKAQKLAKDTQDQGAQFDIQGTPTLLINGAKIDTVSWDEVKARLETMGAR